MRYYVDGYNLMFRIFRSDEELQERRERFLEALREKVDLLNLHLTVVFDSQYQTGEATRSDLGALEIIFTNVGETADDCIINLLKPSQKNVVVTSDKRLASLARRSGARTESSEEFLALLNKRVHNRLRRQKREPKPKEKPVAMKPPVEKPVKSKKPNPKATLAECFDYYLEVFEHKLEEKP